MTTDLTGGLDTEREFVFAEQPDDPEMRESVNAWLWDSGAEFGMPRIGIEAVGDQWDTHDVQVNVAFADGRVLAVFEAGDVHAPLGVDGRPRVLGAGPLSFELVEPYRRWIMRLDGLAEVTTREDQRAGWTSDDGGGERIAVRLEAELVSAVPPWEVGSLTEEASRVLATQEEGDLMGGPRFEQLFRSTGTLVVGDDSHPIDGGGLRIRRTGVRRLARFWGHCWQSAVFPSGRGFGFNTYPPRDDGKVTLNEGYVFLGDGELVPARVVDPPFLRRVEGAGADVSFRLDTRDGPVDVAGQVVLPTVKPLGPPGSDMGLTLEQAIVRYTWDGETANGMLERSIPNLQLEG